MPLLDPQQLYSTCDIGAFDFETTEQIPPAEVIFGQARAVEAITTGLEIEAPGYNLFVPGLPGSNRHGVVRRMLEAHAATRAALADWCYINNFSDPSKPCVLELPVGTGARLQQDMQRFVAELDQAISAGFESDEHRVQVEAAQEEYKEREEGALQELGQAAAAEKMAFLRTPRGFVFVPMKGDETMEPADLENLPDEERARLDKVIDGLRERLRKLLHELPRRRRETQTRIREINRDTTQLAAGHLIEELKERHAGVPAVLAFLDEVLRDVVNNGEVLREHGGGDVTPFQTDDSASSPRRYQVNVIVGHAEGDRAPVVFEDNPIYSNLVGRLDHVAQMGTLVTNFTLIRAGALHRANGGYLLLDAEKLLAQPYAWEGLKRALKSDRIRIESLAQAVGWASAVSLEPEPIPLSVKVVLCGPRRYYYLLRALDSEFEELFKVVADFEDDVDRNPGNVTLYARMLASLVREQGLRPLACPAVARLVEYSSRQAGDAEKLSTRTRDVVDLLRESDHVASRSGNATITREHIDEALCARIHRSDRLRDAVHDAVLRDTVLISTDGTHRGQINGLAVIDLGDFSFARPVRITATAHSGDGGVIDIERKAELGGALHSKGVMILSSFLATRYAPEMPASMSASLVFEQSYGPVEGDSASLAELCALLSAVSGVPIKQPLAVTGSVNQHGRVQAIGAVNEKIEGYFDICNARGLTGEHGVIIPDGNVKHLMLRADVVAAAGAGKFHVHAVAHVDQAVALLTGLVAGEASANGKFPDGTVNAMVVERLARFSALHHSFSRTNRRDSQG